MLSATLSSVVGRAHKDPTPTLVSGPNGETVVGGEPLKLIPFRAGQVIMTKTRVLGAEEERGFAANLVGESEDPGRDESPRRPLGRERRRETWPGPRQCQGAEPPLEATC